MADDKNKKKPAPTQNQTQNKTNEAHVQADKDIEQDAELSAHSPNDDLDEGETARLGEDKTDLV